MATTHETNLHLTLRTACWTTLLIIGATLHGLSYGGADGHWERKLHLPGFLCVFLAAEQLAYNCIPRWYFRGIQRTTAGLLNLRVAQNARWGGMMGIMFIAFALGPWYSIPEHRAVLAGVLVPGIILLAGIIGLEAWHTRYRLRRFFEDHARTAARLRLN
ncbi:hypothetical protein HYV74_00875 [Candidatus Uhrbacteria bacterium]|nr:hypothetical protein [Candidatus Uhrbacteria bacterium]